jgi:hypothetical protein
MLVRGPLISRAAQVPLALTPDHALLQAWLCDRSNRVGVVVELIAPISVDEVAAVLRSLPCGKAADVTGTHVQAVKCACHVSAYLWLKGL